MEPVDRTSGLRARKRTRTKLMVQTEALRLFQQKGYEQTTVDDIAHAAALSSRTFFRYFPTKEDVVLWDEFDDLPFEETWRRGEGDAPVARLLSTIRYMVGELYRRDPDLLLTRFKLAYTVPEVRARFFDQSFKLVGPYYTQLAEAFGVTADDLRLPVILASLFAAMMVALERWQRDDGREDLLRLFDDAIDIVARGLPELHHPGRPGA
jgi:AcrR family transcriptional regulator